ncbi:RING-H2 finger protein ATL57-like [Henckelia pumila]|uniref:RING-H2 finger protein ATL57-like n=1 Tax=Henckelia pumila TaxID=405737 RepID=UPI003C6E76F5
MRLTIALSCRSLLQVDAGTFDADGSTILTHRNDSSSSSSAAAAREPFSPTTPFDTSMALTILIILTALFFMGFFSVYIRRFSADSNPSGAASSSSANARPAPPKRSSGLDPSAVNLLPLVAYDRAEKHPMTEDCPICLTEFQEEERVKQIPYCGHVFHPTCVDTWLASHVTCPLCRSAKLFQEV